MFDRKIPEKKEPKAEKKLALNVQKKAQNKWKGILQLTEYEKTKKDEMLKNKVEEVTKGIKMNIMDAARKNFNCLLANGHRLSLDQLSKLNEEWKGDY